MTMPTHVETSLNPSRGRLAAFVVLLVLVCLATAPAAFATSPSSPFEDEFTLFESGQVRPLAMDPTGKYLYAVNTPDNRLEIFRIKPDLSPAGPLKWVGSVRVGLEPVAVAARSRHEVWVVNHLSDSVSVVNVTSPQHAYVERTLLVGDEPRDIVFAGPDGDRAFITTAHRGQNHPIDPQLTTPSIGRADVWVFDAEALGDSLNGDPLTILSLFTDTPRALAVSPDGSRVYAAGFHSGNRTTIVFSGVVTNGGPDAPDGMGLPAPVANVQGIAKPESGLIVQFDGEHWRDEATGRIWDDHVKFNLPDRDVFTIDATANPPAEVAGESYSGVGTILFNMITNPVTGTVYVSNTEARNERRFEGPGILSGGETVRGRLHQARITVLDDEGTKPRHLNKHIDYDTCCDALPNSVNERSLAQPVDMAISGDGSTLYVAAFGSAKVGVFSTTELENDTFVPNADDHIELTGGGPSGLVLDEQRSRLYVLTRFDNTISVIETVGRQEVARRSLFNPEPAHIQAGRPFLYDARSTSSNGEASCASCHIFGDFDSLSWNLGNPDETILDNPGPLIDPRELFPGISNFHPMKGPMATQSLRGMANHGPMHWRGDRNGNNEAGFSEQPDTGLYDERQAFREFNPAFEGLIGGPAQLSAADMDAFGDFALEITYPPNPIRNLDNSLTASQQRGKDHYFREDTLVTNLFFPDTLTGCNGCHVLDRDGNREFGVHKPGFFGADGRGIVDTGDLQHMKAPHFRNMYQKVGMFGFPEIPLAPGFDFSHKGDQIRGFGFLNDGAVDRIFTFMSGFLFSDLVAPGGFPFNPSGNPAREDMENFLLAFDSNMAPIIGQQVTIHRDSGQDAQNRADLLLARAGATPAECEVVATTRFAGQEVSFLYLADQNVFVPNRNGGIVVSDVVLRLAANLRPVTYTCVPLGSGQRIGLDADLDGCYDRSEIWWGTDPRDADSVPNGCG